MIKKSLLKRKLSQRKGITLIEGLVTVLLFSVLFAACISILMTGSDSWQVSDVKVELQQELRKAVDNIKIDLQQAGPASIISVPADGTWYTSISFRTPLTVISGSIMWKTNPIQFLLGGTGTDQLQRIEGASTRILAQQFTSLQFRRQAASPDIVEVALQVAKDTIKGHTISEALNFKVQLRN